MAQEHTSSSQCKQNQDNTSCYVKTKKPHLFWNLSRDLVGTDWLLNCLLKGNVQRALDYKVILNTQQCDVHNFFILFCLVETKTWVYKALQDVPILVCLA